MKEVGILKIGVELELCALGTIINIIVNQRTSIENVYIKKKNAFNLLGPGKMEAKVIMHETVLKYGTDL